MAFEDGQKILDLIESELITGDQLYSMIRDGSDRGTMRWVLEQLTEGWVAYARKQDAEPDE